MLRQLLSRIYQFGVRLANIGVSDELDFHEKKKTQAMNLCICAGVTPKLVFGLSNLVHGRVILAAINLILLVGGIAILVMHSRKKFVMARLILLISASAFFTVSAILYRNGGEYYLIANFVIIVIFFSETRYLVGISIANFLLFIAIKIFLQTSGYVYDTVPFSRIVFNISWTLIVMMLALWFFKTEQLAYQRQVEEKNSELEQANQTKEKIFSIIAHDLRSPIGQLKGSLELVNREYISAEQFHGITAKLSEQVDQLHNTLDNLLRWSISQLQGITAHPEVTELAPILQDKLKILEQKLEEKKIDLKMEGIHQKLWVDPDHLVVILRNLLSNAIKYSYPGSTISIHSGANKGRVTIAITDTGTGMNKKIRDAVFHSMNIVSQPGTSHEKGTGLGLKLCRELIEKNNGDIFVESSENKGSTFYVSLPQAN